LLLQDCKLDLRLSSRQMGVILPGLKLIVESHEKRQQGEWLGSSALLFYNVFGGIIKTKLRPGKYSQSVMNQIIDLFAQLKTPMGASKRLRVTSVQIRAAILAIRTYQDFLRYEAYRYRKEAKRVQEIFGFDKRSRTRVIKKGRRVIRTLERLLKRANRLEQREAGQEEHSAIVARWRNHLQWVRTHLTYFRRPPPFPFQSRKWIRALIDYGVELAKFELTNRGYCLPSRKNLRRRVRDALRACRETYPWLMENRPKRAAQDLANYVLRHCRLTHRRAETSPAKPSQSRREKRLSWKSTAAPPALRTINRRCQPSSQAPRTTPVGPHRKRHLLALRESTTQELLLDLRRNWRKLDKLEQAEKIAELLRRGCTLRGLARKLPARLTTLRRRRLLMLLPPESRNRLRQGSSAKIILADFQEARRIALLAQRVESQEAMRNRVCEIAAFIIQFAEQTGLTMHRQFDAEDRFINYCYEENNCYRKDSTPKLRREFRRTMRACKPIDKDVPRDVFLWNWLAAALVRIEPIHGLVKPAVSLAFNELRYDERDRRPLKKQAADLWMNQLQYPIVIDPFPENIE